MFQIQAVYWLKGYVTVTATQLLCLRLAKYCISNTVIPQLTKIIRSGITGVSLLAVSNINNPVGLVGLPYVMWSADFFVTHIQTEKISSWNGTTIHVCCFMLVRTSTKTFVSRVRKKAKKKSSLAEKFVSRVVSRGINVFGLIS